MRAVLLSTERCWCCNRMSGPGIKLRRRFHTNLNIYHSAQEANLPASSSKLASRVEKFLSSVENCSSQVSKSNEDYFSWRSESLLVRCILAEQHFAKLLIWLSPEGSALCIYLDLFMVLVKIAVIFVLELVPSLTINSSIQLFNLQL